MKRERNWEALYNTGGIALIAMAGIIIIQMFVFMAAPPPYEGSAQLGIGLTNSGQVFLAITTFDLVVLPVGIAFYFRFRKHDTRRHGKM